MDKSYIKLSSERLVLRPIDDSDTAFIFELVNTKAWKNFIGDFKFDSLDKASLYIKRILAAPKVYYWTVVLASTNQKIGLITFLKRDKLEHFDLGFAFLSEYQQRGYAYEACQSLIEHLKVKFKENQILAITKPSNITSIRLLTKLRFTLVSEVNEVSTYSYNLN